MRLALRQHYAGIEACIRRFEEARKQELEKIP
jgi:hypothetical protein